MDHWPIKKEMGTFQRGSLERRERTFRANVLQKAFLRRANRLRIAPTGSLKKGRYSGRQKIRMSQIAGDKGTKVIQGQTRCVAG